MKTISETLQTPVVAEYDVIVVGGGHAGCEAALACARLGMKTIMFTVSMDSIALMPCNPNIGGSYKGHLVREIDALGGVMGEVADATYIQMKVLNSSKGPAVRALRAQADKKTYPRIMLEFLEKNVCSRKIAVCRELTKTHEEVLRGTAAEHIIHFTENEPRGEFVLVIEGADKNASRTEAAIVTAQDVYDKFNEISKDSLNKGLRRKKNDIIKEVAASFNIPKNQAYDMYEEINLQTRGDL